MWTTAADQQRALQESTDTHGKHGALTVIVVVATLRANIFELGVVNTVHEHGQYDSTVSYDGVLAKRVTKGLTGRGRASNAKHRVRRDR